MAASLEAERNTTLRACAAAHEDAARQRAGQGGMLNTDQRRQVMALVTDLPRLWHDPATPQRERKRMVRLLVEDVTLLTADAVIAQIRFRGGAIQTLRLPLPRSAPKVRKTHASVVAQIERLIDDHTDLELADIPNAQGLRPGHARVHSLREAHSRAWQAWPMADVRQRSMLHGCLRPSPSRQCEVSARQYV